MLSDIFDFFKTFVMLYLNELPGADLVLDFFSRIPLGDLMKPADLFPILGPIVPLFLGSVDPNLDELN